MNLSFAVVVLAVAADGAKPTEKAQGNQAMKEALKSALSAPSTDGGVELDVSRMPFTPDSIRRVITHHQPKVQACYEETLAGKEKDLEGTLMARFIVTAEGLVKGARIEKKGTTLKERKLHDCVVAVLSTMSFPKPSDAREYPVEFPFKLKAVH